jgi:hypothetical protein
LQFAWNRDGAAAFEAVVLEPCPASRLLSRERWWVRKLHAREDARGYNFMDPVESVGYARDFVVHDPRGKVFHVRNLHRFCRERGLNSAILTLVAQGKTHSWRGWACRYAEMSERTWLRRRPSFGRRRDDYIVQDPTGNAFPVDGLFRFCVSHGLDLSAMLNVAEGRQRHHQWWRCWRAEAPLASEFRPARIRARYPDGRVEVVTNVAALARRLGCSAAGIFSAAAHGGTCYRVGFDRVVLAG